MVLATPAVRGVTAKFSVNVERLFPSNTTADGENTELGRFYL